MEYTEVKISVLLYIHIKHTIELGQSATSDSQTNQKHETYKLNWKVYDKII